MIIVKLQGGLGNQMFQYAFGRGLSMSIGQPLEIDISSFSQGGYFGDTNRSFGLNNFDINLSISKRKKFIILFRSRILKKLLDLLRLVGINIFKDVIIEKSYLHDNNIPFVNPISFYVGYWQSEKYFIKFADIIRHEFSLRLVRPAFLFFADSIRNSHPSISVHIRRGDNVNRKKSIDFHGLCPSDYYQQAISTVASMLRDSPVLIIFTDDPKWVKDNMTFKFPAIHISGQGLNEAEELILMSKCSHNIISNSTFSWWGAWLNTNPDKIVIAPKKFYANNKVNVKDLIPDSWISI